MMKKIEYFLNLIHYGFYIFFKISERGIDPFTFKDEAGKKVDGMLVSRGIGACFGGGISLILFSICFIINKVIGVYRNIPFGVFMLLGIITLVIIYYFIYRNDKYLIYVKKFEKEGKSWKYVLISFGFLIACVLFFIFSLKVAV